MTPCGLVPSESKRWNSIEMLANLTLRYGCALCPCLLPLPIWRWRWWRWRRWCKGERLGRNFEHDVSYASSFSSSFLLFFFYLGPRPRLLFLCLCERGFNVTHTIDNGRHGEYHDQDLAGKENLGCSSYDSASDLDGLVPQYSICGGRSHSNHTQRHSCQHTLEGLTSHRWHDKGHCTWRASSPRHGTHLRHCILSLELPYTYTLTSSSAASSQAQLDRKPSPNPLRLLRDSRRATEPRVLHPPCPPRRRRLSLRSQWRDKRRKSSSQERQHPLRQACKRLLRPRRIRRDPHCERYLQGLQPLHPHERQHSRSFLPILEQPMLE